MTFNKSIFCHGDSRVLIYINLEYEAFAFTNDESVLDNWMIRDDLKDALIYKCGNFQCHENTYYNSDKEKPLTVPCECCVIYKDNRHFNDKGERTPILCKLSEHFIMIDGEPTKCNCGFCKETAESL